jgi:hypothetical protein
MNGTFRVPPHQPFRDFLTLGTLGAQVIKFTRVRVPNEPDPVPFVALSRESVVLVAPTLSRELIEPEEGGFTQRREVACLLTSGVLRGSLNVLAPYGGTLNAPTARSLATVIVNLSQAVGISEMQ